MGAIILKNTTEAVAVSPLWGPMLVSMSTRFVDVLKGSQDEEKMQKSLLPVQSIKP